MFTVIICDEKVISDCTKKYSIYVKPLINNKNVVFCPWNTEAESFDEAVPQLRELINNKKEWRAIVVNDSTTWSYDAINKRNPFDYVDSKKTPTEFSDATEIKEFREYTKSAVDRALTNPLARLSVWLCGAPIKTQPSPDYLEQLPDIDSPRYFDKLSAMSLTPYEVEIDWAQMCRYECLSKNFDLEGELFNPPMSIIALAERSKNVESDDAKCAWELHQEFDYSRFYQDNLYSEKLRFLLHDIRYKKGIRNESSYFVFLTVLLLFAANDYPNGAIRFNRVYKLTADIDISKLSDMCQNYRSKLAASILKINNLYHDVKYEQSKPMSRFEFEELFEIGEDIPVKINSSFDTTKLMAEHDAIGLSRNCPQEEYTYWNNQYISINKLFTRYLREPRRAVKTAVKGAFRAKNKIENEDALRIDDYQIEDVEIKLLDEEQSMVETTTTQLFDTAEYSKKLVEADKEVRENISKRMTRRHTVYTGLIALLAYFIGFLPLLFSNMNTVKSFEFSLGMTGVLMVAFALVGIGFLFVMRKKLIKAIKHFNYVMSDILEDIQSGLTSFSRYLAHACNVMRKFSVFDYIKNRRTEKQDTLNGHKRDIEMKLSEVSVLFSDFINFEDDIDTDVKPYDYDFTIRKRYEYKVPYSEVPTRITFLQPGNVIPVEIDYLSNVNLIREELYD